MRYYWYWVYELLKIHSTEREIQLSQSQREAPKCAQAAAVDQKVAKDATPTGSATWDLLCNDELRVRTDRCEPLELFVTRLEFI